MIIAGSQISGIDALMIFYKTFLRFISLLTITCCLGLQPLTAQTPVSSSNIAQALHREKALKNALSISDSIKILLDAYNLSDKLNRDRLRIQIINLTERSDNQDLISEALKDLSNSTDDAGQLSKLLEITESLPEGNDRDKITTILEMEKAQKEAPTVSDSHMRQEVTDYAINSVLLSQDPYKEIQKLYRAMSYLGASSQGPLYLEYIKRLDDIVNSLPEKDHRIRNLFYTTAAIFYTRKRDYKTAIAYDRKLIKELDAIKEYLDAQNDKTHNLDYFYYVSYRRMLRNFMGLTPEEIEDIYQKCVELANQDETVNEAFNTGGLTKSYYYIATHQFAKAVPELKKALNDETISTFRRQELLGLLAWALNETGDKNGELMALREYTSMMLADMDQRRENTYREIELRNSVNKLLTDEYIAQERERDEEKVMGNTSLTILYVLALILIFLTGAYFRLRSKVKELEIRNTKLHRNIEHIFDDGMPKGTTDLRHQKNRLKG